MVATAPHQRSSAAATSSPRTALVIDDERPIRRLLRVLLEVQGYQVWEAETGDLGLQLAASRRPDVILLDLGLPDMDGLTVLKRLREWTRTPVLILTLRDSEADKVAALDNGADDYMTKPFGGEELLARLRALRRHSPEAQEEPTYVHGDLTVDIKARKVTVKDNEVHLTPTEYALLHELVRHAGQGGPAKTTAPRRLGTRRGEPVTISAGVHHVFAQEAGDTQERETDRDATRYRLSSVSR